MSRASAMAAYVDEMKKVAQEVSNAYFVISSVQNFVELSVSLFLSLVQSPTKTHTNTINVLLFFPPVVNLIWENC